MLTLTAFPNCLIQILKIQKKKSRGLYSFKYTPYLKYISYNCFNGQRFFLLIWKQTLLDDATELWGIWVARVEIKDVRIPVQLQRSMAAEAEATREARARVRATVFTLEDKLPILGADKHRAWMTDLALSILLIRKRVFFSYRFAWEFPFELEGNLELSVPQGILYMSYVKGVLSKLLSCLEMWVPTLVTH